jgi:chromosome segregation ATPase
MDWIMELPPELINAITAATVAIVGAFSVLVVTILGSLGLAIKKFSENQAKREEADTKREVADAKREDMINTWALDWDKRGKHQQVIIDEQNNKIGDLREANAELRGKVEMLLEHQKIDHENWNRQRSELSNKSSILMEKINKLEKRLAELEHENKSKDELIQARDELISRLKHDCSEAQKQLEKKDEQLNQLTIGWDKTKAQLSDCEDEREQDSKVVDMPQQKTEADEDKKDIA